MKKGKIVIGLVVAFCLATIIVGHISHKSIAKILKNNPNYTYSTSLTSNYDRSDKANIYTTNMSVKDTARDIMSQDYPEDHTDLDNEEAIQLTYDNHYVLIYENEKAKTYVQVSSRKYIHNNGYNGLYRPRRSNIAVLYSTLYTTSRYYTRDSKRYGNAYTKAKGAKTVNNTTTKNTTTKDTTTKINTDKNASTKIKTRNSKTKSIRSSSIGSKSRLGGGTSFGK